LGIEIDEATQKRELPPNAELRYDCAFATEDRNWDAVIGNPPYVRHHYIELPWTESIARRFKKSLGVQLHGQANLFVYFLLLGIELSKENGVVAMLTPYEWVSRPSAKPLRDLIERSGWGVSVYRFCDEIFDGVMTTASICIIDKAETTGKWTFHEISADGSIHAKRQRSGTKHLVLPYEKRGKCWALRGLSPGTQKVFTLTEGERIHHGLGLTDVWPCVTSLMPLPPDYTELNAATFRKYYRDAGEKCWLIKSSEKTISPELMRYLDGVDEALRDTATCTNRETWYAFKPFPVGRLLVASAFTKFGPKIVKNTIRAHHVGSVYGTFGPATATWKLLNALREFDFERRVVQHSGKLKKIEVRQLNSVLSDVCQ
jgi:hypothetical protein